ncbi:MAG: lysophospholipid acyltransferase family protein [Gammaproteobacteria bacterium]|nr:lysophospholipid acyltransferase family protein [Gammaproteobacteria bacterium]
MQVRIISTPLLGSYLHPRYWPTWWGLAGLWLLAQLPHHWRRGCGQWLGTALLARNRKRAAIVATNLLWTQPQATAEERRQWQQRFYRWSGQSFLEFGQLWWSPPRSFHQQVAIFGGEWISETLQQRPVILVTGHALALDAGGMAISARWPMVTYANRMRNPLIQAVMAKGRSRFGVELLQRESGMRPLLRALQRGRLLYYVVDEDLGAHSSTFAPFYGVAKATLDAPARIAKMSQAVVAACYCWFDADTGRYRLEIGPPAMGFPSGDRLQDATALNRMLQQSMAVAPEQYLWSQRLFQTRPDGSPPPYTMKGKPGSGPRGRPEGS